MTDTEQQIAKLWEALFSPLQVSVIDDFFLDLGGHSLLAAKMVSELRKNPRFARVSVLEVYEHPTIVSLASALDAGELRSLPSDTSASAADAREAPRPDERRRHFFAGIFQAAGLYFVFSIRAIEWLTRTLSTSSSWRPGIR